MNPIMVKGSQLKSSHCKSVIFRLFQKKRKEKKKLRTQAKTRKKWVQLQLHFINGAKPFLVFEQRLC
jgi:hypothetical protein